MVLFGVIQIVMSQIPDFHNMEWLSIVAAIMSFSYASIGLGLGFAKVVGNIVNQFVIFVKLHDATVKKKLKPVDDLYQDQIDIPLFITQS